METGESLWESNLCLNSFKGVNDASDQQGHQILTASHCVASLNSERDLASLLMYQNFLDKKHSNMLKTLGCKNDVIMTNPSRTTMSLAE